jgi:hypothetical protein
VISLGFWGSGLQGSGLTLSRGLRLAMSLGSPGSGLAMFPGAGGSGLQGSGLVISLRVQGFKAQGL